MIDQLEKNYIKNFNELSCDYLVVGSGAGGSVACNELVKRNKNLKSKILDD